MVLYILFVCFVKWVGDYLYEESQDPAWFKYLLTISVILGAVLYVGT